MSKKKKKIVRPQYTSKEERAKQKPRKPIAKELKWGILFCACALVLAVILFVALYDDGSLPMRDGAPVMEGNNWLVANTGTSSSPKYYKIGEAQAVPGYTLDPEAESYSDLVLYTYRPDDPDSRIDNYYITGINQTPAVNAQSANTNYKSWMSTATIGDVEHATIDGLAVEYFMTSMPATNEAGEVVDTGETQQQLIAYIPTIRNTSVLCAIAVNATPELPELPEADFVALLEEITRSIVYEEK